MERDLGSTSADCPLENRLLPVFETFRSRRWIWGGVLCALYLLTRCLYLDSDAPPWNVAQYGAIDETYYTIPAFNLFHYGTLSHQAIPFVPDDGGPFAYLLNLLTWVALELFGNTFYGLRGGAVLAGLILLLLLSLILNASLKRSGEEGRNGVSNPRWIVVVWLFYLLTDFNFLLASRTAEPTLTRALALLCVLGLGYSTLLQSDSPLTGWKSAWAGGIATACVAFVYPNNFFLIPAVFMAVVIWNWRFGKRSLLRSVFCFILACGFCAFLYWGVVRFLHGRDLFYDLNWIRNACGERVREPAVSDLVVGLRSIFRANLFRYSPWLYFAILVALPVFLHKTFTMRRSGDLVLLCVLFFFEIQNMFTSDYDFPSRKHFLILPVVSVLVVGAWDYLPIFRTQMLQTVSRRGMFAGYCVLAYLWVLRFQVGSAGLPGSTGQKLIWFTILSAGVTTAVAFLVLCRIFDFRSFCQFLSVCVSVAILLPGIGAAWVVIYRNPTYTHRDAMKALAPEVDGKIVVGWSYPMRLYNASIPVLNTYIYVSDEKRREQIREMWTRIYREKLALYTIRGPEPSPATLGVPVELVRVKVFSTGYWYSYKDLMWWELSLPEGTDWQGKTLQRTTGFSDGEGTVLGSNSGSET